MHSCVRSRVFFPNICAVADVRTLSCLNIGLQCHLRHCRVFETSTWDWWIWQKTQRKPLLEWQLKAGQDTLEYFKWPRVAKFRQLKESLKAGFSHHTILYNPPGLQLFMGNLCFSWINPVSHHADVLGTRLHLKWYCVLVFRQLDVVLCSAGGIQIQALKQSLPVHQKPSLPL